MNNETSTKGTVFTAFSLCHFRRSFKFCHDCLGSCNIIRTKEGIHHHLVGFLSERNSTLAVHKQKRKYGFISHVNKLSCFFQKVNTKQGEDENGNIQQLCLTSRLLLFFFYLFLPKK